MIQRRYDRSTVNIWADKNGVRRHVRDMGTDHIAHTISHLHRWVKVARSLNLMRGQTDIQYLIGKYPTYPTLVRELTSRLEQA